MLKTLGGDRLGSGSKMKVDLHNYGRSTHDLSYVWRSTMSAGTLVPFMSKIILPGDTFDIDLHLATNTHPTIGPLFGSYKAQLDIFQAPIRLYNSLLHNNALGIGLNMSKVKLPQIALIAQPDTPGKETYDNNQINPSCLLAYVGIRGIGTNFQVGSVGRNFNALSILMYWDIVKNYYANKQEEIGAVIHTPSVTLIETIDDIKIFHTGTESTLPESPSGGSIPIVLGDQIRLYYTGTIPLPEQVIINTQEKGDQTANALSTGVWTTATGYIWSPFRQTFWGNLTLLNWRYINNTDINTGKPQIATFPLTNIDNMRKQILAYADETTPFVINENTDNIPYAWLGELVNDIPNSLSSQEGLALKTYQSDLFNNWLQTEWIDGVGGIADITSIDTSAGNFKIDAFLLAKKVYDMLNRIAVSGGSYDDWLDAVYAHDRYQRCETPMYMGGMVKELIFQEVVSNSESSDQPLGTLAGKGVLAKGQKGGHVVIKCDEPSYLIGIVSLTPRIDYSQGNSWDTHLETLDDLHKPGLDQIGFQELITEQMAAWDTQFDGAQWITKSAGKQPAWINYMTSVNETHGNFAIPTNEMFMTLNRRYEVEQIDGHKIKDLTTYIDPSKYNFIFAETALDAQNFWVQIAVDITARRKMSAKLMPNL